MSKAEKRARQRDRKRKEALRRYHSCGFNYSTVLPPDKIQIHEEAIPELEASLKALTSHQGPFCKTKVVDSPGDTLQAYMARKAMKRIGVTGFRMVTAAILGMGFSR